MSGLNLMIQGVRAGIGKSLIMIGWSRYIALQGKNVGVFKAQAMEDRFVKLADGGLIPANLVLAAKGCGQTLTKHMCPILMTPTDPIGDAIDNLSLNLTYNVYVLGESLGQMSLADYYRKRSTLWPIVQQSLNIIRMQHDNVVLEGSGNPVELNSYHKDFCNMDVAREANASVLLVADLALGGSFSAIAGVLNLLKQRDRCLVKGIILNKALSVDDLPFLQLGIEQLEAHTTIPVLGAVPIIPDKVFDYPKQQFMNHEQVVWSSVYDKWTNHMMQSFNPGHVTTILNTISSPRLGGSI